MSSPQASNVAGSTHRRGVRINRLQMSSPADTGAAAHHDGFLVVTIASVAYLLFVLVYNARLLETLSVGASRVDLEFIENFGTVLAGAGISLLAWRLQQRLFRGNHLWPLVGYLVVSVPLMWGLQEWAVRALVNAASPGQLRASYVASLGTDGLRSGNRKLKNFEWLSDDQRDYDAKTFFALFPALANRDTALVAAIETALPDLVRHTVQRREGSADTRFRDYENEEFRFRRIYREAYAAPAQRPTKPQQDRRPDTEPTGRAAASEPPLIPANLPPGLSWLQFSKRDDIRESFAHRMGYQAERFLDFGLQRSEFIERVYEPMIRLRAADMLRPLDDVAGFGGESVTRQRGIDTYRAAIEPAVGLAFSLLLALLNAVLLVASIVFRSPPVVTAPAQ